MSISNKELKEEYQKFLDELSKEEYQKFLNAKSQEEFLDDKTRARYIKFINAKLKVKFLDPKIQEEYQIRHNKLPDIKSKEEFWNRFLKLYNFLDSKGGKSTAENALQEHLKVIKNHIEKQIPIIGDKNKLNYTLPYFEMAGGWEMMLESDIGKEATDLLYYFVQNYLVEK
jgi:hypothetical protein